MKKVSISNNVYVKEYYINNWFNKIFEYLFGLNNEYIENIKYKSYNDNNIISKFENIKSLKKYKISYIKDELLDNSPRTNGKFASHIGIIGNNPKKWKIFNRELAYMFVPELAKEIEDKDILLLKMHVLFRWKGFVMKKKDIRNII